MAKKKKAGKFFIGFLIALLCSCLSLVLWLPGYLDSLEGLSFDLRARAFPGKADKDIVLLVLDQKSLDKMALPADPPEGEESGRGEGWPWRREYWAQLVNFCTRAGAKSVAFDVFFSDASNYGPDDDAYLMEAIVASDRYVGPIQLQAASGKNSSWREGLAAKMPWLSAGSAEWEERFGKILLKSSILYNREEFDRSSEALGNVIFASDAGGIYRRIAPLVSFDGAAVPSLTFASYLSSRGIGELSYAKGGIRAGEAFIPLDSRGRAILRFRGPTMTHTAISVYDIIGSEINIQNEAPPLIDPALLQGKYVIVGSNAPGLQDLRASPFGDSENYSGMEIHATFLDNLLNGDFIRETPWYLAGLYIFTLSLLFAACLLLVKRTWSQILVNVLAFAFPVGLAFLAYVPGLWLPLIPALLASAFTTVSMGLYNFRTEGRQKVFLKGAFKQYLSPVVIEQLIANPDKLNLGGERRELSMHFSDIQGFTSLSENLDPVELTAVLNEYLSAMSDIIMGEGGTIDKYEGDAIIAFWNAPLDLPDHAVRSVRSALRCQEALASMRQGLFERTGKMLYHRIGLNTGPAVVGNMGSKNRFDYTMMGDAVNLAARLEGVNKQFGTYTMISRSTYDKLGGAFPCRELSRIAVVGKKQPVEVYEPMTREEWKAREADMEIFAQGLEAYYAGDFSRALDHFSKTEKTDPPAGRYAERCRKFLEAAPENWDGVWTMTEK